MNDTEAPADRLGRTQSAPLPALARLRSGMGSSATSIFLREWIRHPAEVGAVWPSSDRLARRMADCVPRSGDGLVIELGAGTGCVTKALLEGGIRADRLVVVERSSQFVRHLRRRFPALNVLHGDALRLAHLLPAAAKVDAIVSSLPLRSLPQADARQIVSQWQKVLRRGGHAVQFSYDLRDRLRHECSGLEQRASHVVWANVPPARVFVLEACP
jgi:phospholipid N-methyltransferase